MRGGERQSAASRERLQDCRRQRAALGGVGPAPNLVHENERALARMLEDVAQRRHMRGKRGKARGDGLPIDRKSTRLNSSQRCISYAVFCLKKKKKIEYN